MVPLLRLVALLVFCSAVFAQSCPLQWQPGDPVPYAHGNVVASVTWDPDGAGPAPAVLVFGGAFSAGTMLGTPIAAYDGSQWLPLGTPSGNFVSALTVSNGVLVAASQSVSFATMIDVWNGTAWVPIGNVAGRVDTMTTHGGALVVGGWFSSVSGVGASNIAQFDGNGWSALGSGTNGEVYALASFAGALHVGGTFTNAGGLAVQNHALWNNPSWFAGASFNGPIETFAVRAATAITQTYLFAGGGFTTVGAIAATHVARLTQSTNAWTALGSGLAGTTCQHLFVRATGINTYELTAAVLGSSDEAWRWTGSTWTVFGSLVDDDAGAMPQTIAWFGGSYVLGLSSAERAVRKFDGMSQWLPLLGHGIDERVATSLSIGDEFVIGGLFKTISGVVMNGVARGTPGAWQPLGSGVDGGFGVFALATLPNGDLVAGGDFTTAGGVPAAHLARWDGTSWTQFGGGVDDVVYALAVLPNGDLVAAGRFTTAGGLARNRIARWNGSTWLALGSGSPSQIDAVKVAANGDLLVGGNFLTIGGVSANHVARWNGSVWSALGTGADNAVFALDTAPNGDVVIGGAFVTAGGVAVPHVARWNGSAWSAVGTSSFYYPQGDVYAVAVLPDGDVVAAGGYWSWSFSIGPLSSTIAGNVARFSPSAGTWNTLGTHGVAVSHLRVLPEGGLVVGGLLDYADAPCAHFAKLATTCPATAQPFGVGCNGNTLTATTLPWVESTLRTVGTNLPTTAIVLTATSVTSVPQGVAPLAGIFAQGAPGCDVLVAPDILGAIVTTNGTATSSLYLPDSPPLVGVTFFHQMIPIAVDAQGAWTSVTATNALQLTAGSF